MAPKAAKAKAKQQSDEGTAANAKGLAAIDEEAGKLGHKGAQAVRDKLLALKKLGKPKPMEDYQQLSSMKDKFQFALKLKLDPTGAFCYVEESSSCSASNKESSLTGWMSKWEFAKLVGLKYDLQDLESMAILDAELEGFKTRPHEKEVLASKGHLQYFIQKKNPSESIGEKKREVKGMKRQQCSSEELEAIEGMIDLEEPVPAVAGRVKDQSSSSSKKKKLTETDKQAKKQEEESKRQKMLEGMSSEERKEFEAKETYDLFIKELKEGEKKLQAALSMSFKYSGKLQTMKETRWVSPKRMIAGLKAQGEKMTTQSESVQTSLGLLSNLAYGAINNKKFQEVARCTKKCLEEWQGFKDSIAKHID